MMNSPGFDTLSSLGSPALPSGSDPSGGDFDFNNIFQPFGMDLTVGDHTPQGITSAFAMDTSTPPMRNAVASSSAGVGGSLTHEFLDFSELSPFGTSGLEPLGPSIQSAVSTLPIDDQVMGSTASNQPPQEDLGEQSIAAMEFLTQWSQAQEQNQPLPGPSNQMMDYQNGGGEQNSLSQANYQALQQQLAQIHMQSPALFASHPPHPNSHSNPAQSDPSLQYSDPTHPGPGFPNNLTQANLYQVFKGMNAKEMSMAIAAGQILTPAQSTEMFPNRHQETVSPLPLGGPGMGMSDGALTVDERGELVFTPLMSPAMNHQTHQVPPPQQSSQLPSHSAAPYMDAGQQLQQIQMQQQELQRQLDQLQMQQHSTNTSPYISPTLMVQNQQGHSGHSASPHLNNYPTSQFQSHVAPSPADSFSPLTSPALRPQNGTYPAQSQRSRSAIRHSRNASRSNMSSPIITGYSQHQSPLDTTQQQYSPINHLPPGGPQGMLGSDQQPSEYLANFNRMLEQGHQAGIRDMSSIYEHQTDGAGSSTPMPGMQSPYISSHNSGQNSINPSPQQQSTNGRPALGPHRSSHSSKTRPSPLIKPSNRGGRQSGTTPNLQAMTSPLVAGWSTSIPELSSLPMQSDLSNGAGSGSLSHASTSISTPSPVDLSHNAMPPPPVPKSQARRMSGAQGHSKPFAPMTPASLMHLSHEELAETSAAPSQRKESVGEGSKRARAASTSKRDSLDTVVGVASGSSGKSSGTSGGRRTVPSSPVVKAVNSETPKGKASAKATKGTKASKPEPVVDDANIPPEARRSSHKVAEQKRRDSLKQGFDVLRCLLPPINTDVVDEFGEIVAGSSAPRLLPRSSLVPDDNPNKSVSKVTLLRFSNDYIKSLQAKVGRRDNYIELLKEAVRSVRTQAGLEMDDITDQLLNCEFEDEEEEDDLAAGSSIVVVGKGKGVARQVVGDEGNGVRMDVSDEELDLDSATENPLSKSRRPSISSIKEPKATGTTAGKKGKSISSNGSSSVTTSPVIKAVKGGRQTRGSAAGQLDVDMAA